MSYVRYVLEVSAVLRLFVRTILKTAHAHVLYSTTKIQCTCTCGVCGECGVGEYHFSKTSIVNSLIHNRTGDHILWSKVVSGIGLT